MNRRTLLQLGLPVLPPPVSLALQSPLVIAAHPPPRPVIPSRLDRALRPRYRLPLG